jgi:hypothetical protein
MISLNVNSTVLIQPLLTPALTSSQLTKNPDGIILYEAQANPSDHTKVKGLGEMGGSRLGM